MTNIEVKANELYPVQEVRAQGIENAYYDRNEKCRIAFVKACKWLLSELSGTTKEAEEVLKEYVFNAYLNDEYEDLLVYKVDALKAMQTMYAMGSAKEREEVRSEGIIYDLKKRIKEVESLQQQLDQVCEASEDWARENVDLKKQLSEKEKEIERLNDVIDRNNTNTSKQ